jgi:hypothetical protein
VLKIEGNFSGLRAKSAHFVGHLPLKEVSGMDYMAYYRNREAFQLFQEHSTHLRKEREQKQAKRQTTNRKGSRKTGKGQASSHLVKVSPHDPLLDYKRPRLVELLHEARAERDEAKRQAKTERVETEQRMQAERADLEQRYHKLLQEHMSCGVTTHELCNELLKSSEPAENVPL